MDVVIDPQARGQRFRRLYSATYLDLLRFARRRVSPAHAEDIVGDVMLVAWRRWEDVPTSISTARAWLFGVAYKTIQNHLRREDKHRAIAVQLADVSAVPAEVDSSPEAVCHRLDVASAWPLLSAAHQEAIILTALDGLSSTEAASVLDISPVAFRLRLSRARRSLRHHLSSPAVDRHQPGGVVPARSPQ